MKKGKLFNAILVACVLFALVSCPNPGTPPQVERTAETGPGSAHIEMNERTGTVHRAYGLMSPSAAVPGKRFLEEQRGLLNIDPDDLELVSERGSLLKNQRYVTYRQVYKGIPVYGSSVGYTVKYDGAVPILGAVYHPGITIDVRPAISAAAAAETARRAASALTRKTPSIKGHPELLVLPVAKGDAFDFLLVYRVKAEAKGFSWTYMVDAASGVIVRDYSNMRNDVSGRVKLQYYSPDPNGQVKEYSGWGWGGVTLHAYSASGRHSVYYTQCELDGSYYFSQSGVRNYIEAEIGPGALYDAWAYIEGVFIPAESHYSQTRTWAWTVSPANNLFVRMNKMHDYFAQYTSQCNYIMPAVIEWDENNGARADGYKIWIGRARGEFWCLSDDVVYHEYTHNIIYRTLGSHFYEDMGTVQGYAMDEGLADYFAGSNSNSSVIGEFYNMARDLYNKNTWDPNQDPHLNGLVIGGACWDLRRYLGQATADRLVFEAIEMSPEAASFEDFAKNIAVADDNDGNLGNGVPHGYYINRAFETNHGINFPWY